MSFADRLKKYGAAASSTVPVNPPEAVKVLEEKTAPETEGEYVPSDNDAEKKPEPAPKEKKSRGKKDAPAATPATSAPSVSGQSAGELGLSTEALVAELRNRGYAVTLVAAV